MGKHTSVRLTDEEVTLLDVASLTLTELIDWSFTILREKVLNDSALRAEFLGTCAEKAFWARSDRAAALNLSASVRCHCMGRKHEPGCAGQAEQDQIRVIDGTARTVRASSLRAR
jgi:hypothetical protein